jgi:hypothetical protein
MKIIIGKALIILVMVVLFLLCGCWYGDGGSSTADSTTGKTPKAQKTAELILGRL